jgi:hypothetical protein
MTKVNKARCRVVAHQIIIRYSDRVAWTTALLWLLVCRLPTRKQINKQICRNKLRSFVPQYIEFDNIHHDHFFVLLASCLASG